jgi:glycosyltransferase involved in cell wall biosynthesis
VRLALISAFVFDNSIGGLENHIRFMVQELSRRGHELVIFKPVWQDEYDREEATVDGCNIRFVNLGCRPYNVSGGSGSRALAYLVGFLNKAAYSTRSSRLVKAVSDWQPDLVWQHDFSSSWVATRRLSKRFPVVLTNHTGEYLMLRGTPVARPLLSWLLRHYSAVIGPSLELTPSSIGNSHTIHNGVDTKLFFRIHETRKPTLKQELFGDPRKYVVFCPRRWAPTKGIVFLAMAIRELERKSPNASDFLFVFAGSDYGGFPEYVAEVNRVLQGTSMAVMKLGNLNVHEMAKYYQASDVVAIPSLMEAVSLSALEAMATGTPVLSTNVGGMGEIIRPGETGYLVPPKNATALCEALQEIACDPSSSQIAERAFQLVHERYSWGRIADQTEAVLLPASLNSAR